MDHKDCHNNISTVSPMTEGVFRKKKQNKCKITFRDYGAPLVPLWEKDLGCTKDDEE